MFSWINSMYGPFKVVCQHILNVCIDICPRGVLGSILGMVVFVLVTGAAVFGIVLLLRRLHSGAYVQQVTWPYTKNHFLMGAAIGIAGLVNPNDGDWRTILTVVFAVWAAITLLLMARRVFLFDNPPHGKLLYMSVGIEYLAVILAIGMFSLLIAYVAIAVVIAVLVGAAVIGGGLKGMFPGGGGGSAPVPQHREGTLDDGTRIVEEGASWREVGGSAAYRENMDGTFSKTS